MVERYVLNIAHRGASGRFPENTLASFRAAIDAGAQICELDVQATRDGAIVVMHDDTVERTTDGTGAVKSLTLEEIHRLDAGVRFGAKFIGERVPTLDEVFAIAGPRCALNIELKAAGLERRIIDIIEKHRATASALVSSFDWDAIAIVRHLEPRVRIGLLASQWPARLVGAAFELRAETINPRVDIVTEDLCIAAHQRNLNVYAWVADQPDEMRRLIAIGVDGIMTNYPERLRALVELS
ncbi:MAG TPA: glycerophosphodiester phosphodiesterase family protein [Candidatus Binataceae bacterium]|nr:glycerophosphodiester phosphodiesterase family protein [Candidatus Binataceae bacterium]